MRQISIKDDECRGNFFTRNGKGEPVAKFDSNIFLSGISFYEVMKVTEHIPLFLEEHLARLQNSVREKHVSNFPPLPLIKGNIEITIDLNNMIRKGNIRLILNYSATGPDIYCYYIPHYYPSSSEYEKGVSLIPVHAERKDAHSKIIDIGFRSKIRRLIMDENAYEALLIDRDGFITEGSKSNFFMIKDGKVTTAPEKDVLPGITRKHVMDICRTSGIEVEEKKIPYSEAKTYNSCFITGTSPGILGIRNIGPVSFKTDDPLLRKLSSEYESIVNNYITTNRKVQS